MSTRFTISVSILAAVTIGCGEEPTNKVVLQPPAAGHGVQIKMTSTLDPQLETERCMFWRVPDEGLFVNREEVRYTPGSHHVLLFKTPYTELPTMTIRGEAIDTNGVFDCGKNGATGDWEVLGAAGGAQSADGPPGVDGLPADTAFKMEGGGLLLVNAHYLNASDQPLDAEIYINLHTVPAAQVTREAGIFFMYNPFIYVGAQSASQAREVCPLAKDVTLVNAQSHMHARGKRYLANLLDRDGTTLQEIYSTNNWEAVVSKTMAPPLQIAAGQMIDFRCDYMNNETRNVFQGRTTRDEMCMFVGLYYPKDTKTELCSMTDDWKGRYLGANWIGSGSATGAETAGCLQTAIGATGAAGDFDACIVNACPAISAPTSDAARCLATRGLGMCPTECEAGDTAACKACVGTKCTPAMNALAGAACP